MDWAGAVGGRVGLWQALGRDGLTRASSDEVRQLELCRYMWWARHIVVFAGFTLGIWQDGWARTQWLSGAMLVSQVVAAEDLNDTLENVLKDVRAASPLVLRLNTRTLKASRPGNFADLLGQAEKVFLEDLMTSADPVEGIEAFYGKRAPEWRNA